MSKNKLFFYDFDGKRRKKTDTFVSLVSEIKLPPFSRKFREVCAHEGETKFRNIPLGTKLTLAFGDPRVIEDVTLVSMKKGDVPKNILELLSGPNRVFTFEYQGKKFWAEPCWICRLEDLEKVVSKEKRARSLHMDAHNNPN